MTRRNPGKSLLARYGGLCGRFRILSELGRRRHGYARGSSGKFPGGEFGRSTRNHCPEKSGNSLKIRPWRSPASARLQEARRHFQPSRFFRRWQTVNASNSQRSNRLIRQARSSAPCSPRLRVTFPVPASIPEAAPPLSRRGPVAYRLVSSDTSFPPGQRPRGGPLRGRASSGLAAVAEAIT